MISDPLILSIVIVFIMFTFLLSSIWIGVSLILTGIIAMLIFEHSLPPTLSIFDKIGDLLASSMYDSLNSWSLAALPIFILMGEILYKSSISTRLLNGLTPWLSFIPGKLLHVNVVACSLFAAISGSSSATTATVGKITLDELQKRGYSKSLALGSLAGSGTLGFLIPPSLIMIIYGAVVLGSIYGGFATPTEAASLGVLGAIILATYFKSLSLDVMKNALLNTIKTSVMISFIIVGAGFLSHVVGFLGIARAISEFIGAMGLSPFALIVIIGIMYVFLGMILDGISIVVMTLPIVLPIILFAGFDPLWFGIFLVFMVELSQITPPVGFSLFIIQSISGEKIEYILKATLPFFLLMIVAVVIITVFPEIVHFLPNYMTAK